MGKMSLRYPQPRQPGFPTQTKNIEELKPAVRAALKRKTGKGALGVAKPGDKVLIVYPPPQDILALKATIEVFRESGIEAEGVAENEIQGIPAKELKRHSSVDGWEELTWRKQVSDMLGIKQSIPPNLMWTPALQYYLDERPKHNAIFTGDGGDSYWIAGMKDHAPKYRGSWLLDTAEHLLSKIEEFPNDVLDLIEHKIVDIFPRVSEVRITDPQGTDVSWTLTAEEARVWGAVQPVSGHLFVHPNQSFAHVDSDLVKPSQREAYAAQGLISPIHRVFAKAEGVIAGTANHAGYFPHMKTYLKDGQVYKIEGGGKFGDGLRKWLEETKDVHYPFYPKPGNLYLIEVALGTHPKFFRKRVDLFDLIGNIFSNVYERQRSGVLHWGIGVDDFHPQLIEYAEKNKLPYMHIGHAAHTYFNTIEFKLRDTGEWVKIADKGRLTALDDPKVKGLTAKYGDPADILMEEWVPAIPGINYPGDYMRDYGHDPVAWIQKEIKNQLPPTIGVPSK